MLGFGADDDGVVGAAAVLDVVAVVVAVVVAAVVAALVVLAVVVDVEDEWPPIIRSSL